MADLTQEVDKGIAELIYNTALVWQACRALVSARHGVAEQNEVAPRQGAAVASICGPLHTHTSVSTDAWYDVHTRANVRLP